MNLRLNPYLILLIILLSAGRGIAQNNSSARDSSEVSAFGPDLKDELPPLENLIQIAIKNSPFLKLNDALIEKSEAQSVLARKEWHNYFSAFGNYSIGNQRFLIANPDQAGYQSNFLNGYRAGINISMPLSVVTTRGARIRAADAEVKATEFQRQQSELDLKNRVVEEYYELMAASNVLKIKSLAKENAELQNEIGEKKFSEGGMSLEEYTNLGRTVTNALVDYEMAKTNFNVRYKKFEQLLGVSMENLRKKK
jgi:outer membrane protein TolC